MLVHGVELSFAVNERSSEQTLFGLAEEQARILLSEKNRSRIMPAMRRKRGGVVVSTRPCRFDVVDDHKALAHNISDAALKAIGVPLLGTRHRPFGMPQYMDV